MEVADVSGEKDWAYWLMVTNLALALVVLGSALIVWGAVVWEFLKTKAVKAPARSSVDEELSALLREESHHILVPELGLTMADGGEKHEAPDNKR
jgi:hypothetical protein